MRSKAHYLKGHPIHPMLIPFPIAFLLGAFVFDAIGVGLGRPGWYTAAKYLCGAGLVMGLVAAVPGLIDYLWAIPPDSSAKRHGRRHMLLNVTVLILFAVAFWVRGGPGVPPDPPILGLELIGALLLTWSGFIGGTLAYRNQIGVDHRYAGAGKWRERAVALNPGQAVVVARADELKPGQMKLVRAGTRRIVVARLGSGAAGASPATAGSDEAESPSGLGATPDPSAPPSASDWVAFDDRCTHRGGTLADGALACDVVQCPWHGSQFDVRTGAVRAGPATDGIGTYRVEVRGDEIAVVL